MIRNVIFDVNETLLDTAALEPLFTRLFGASASRQEWFLTLQECWLTATIIDRFQPFSQLASASLKMVGQRRGVRVRDEDCESLISAMKAMPAHGDVGEALALLKSGGLRVFALTNGSLQAARQQLDSSGLTEFFDEIFSVEGVKRYKPAAEPYRMALEHLGVPAGEVVMVAAHAWDMAGANSAGLKTAFVERPGKVINPAGLKPDIIGADLLAVARQILDRKGTA